MYTPIKPVHQVNCTVDRRHFVILAFNYEPSNERSNVGPLRTIRIRYQQPDFPVCGAADGLCGERLGY